MAEYRTGGFYDFLGEVLLAAGKGAVKRIEDGGSAKDVGKEAAKGTIEKGAEALKQALADAPAAAQGKVAAAVKAVEAQAKTKATTNIMLWIVVAFILLGRKGR